MTECTQQGFAFEGHCSRRVVAEFSGDRLTTEGGALLLREADRKIGLLRRVADCFTDTRQPERVRAPPARDAGTAHLRIGAGLGRPERSRAVAE